MEAVLDIASGLQEAARAVARRPYDLVLVEMETLPTRARAGEGPLFGGLPPVVALGRKEAIRDAVWALHAGARDYLWMPTVDKTGVRWMLRRALRSAAARRSDATDSAEAALPFEDFITLDHGLLAACDALSSAADSALPVLIRGESGTGKTTLARKVHTHSVRRLGPLVELNCNTRPVEDLADEFFGREGRDARDSTEGKLAQADGGTLLVEGADRLPAKLLSELLDGSQQGAFRRNGRVLECAVRFVMTLGADGPEDPAGGQVETVAVRLPPLRCRPGDIPLLADHFLRLFRRNYGAPVMEVGAEALSALVRYRWPGNVRELRNCVEHSVLLASRSTVGLTDLPRCVVENHQPGLPCRVQPEPGPLREAMRKPEKEYILRALQQTDGNKRHAARQLQISRSTLYKKLREHGLDDALTGREH